MGEPRSSAILKTVFRGDSNPSIPTKAFGRNRNPILTISTEGRHSIRLSTCKSIVLSKSIFGTYSVLGDVLFLIKLETMSTQGEKTKRSDHLPLSLPMVNEQASCRRMLPGGETQNDTIANTCSCPPECSHCGGSSTCMTNTGGASGTSASCPC